MGDNASNKKTSIQSRIDGLSKKYDKNSPLSALGYALKSYGENIEPVSKGVSGITGLITTPMNYILNRRLYKNNMSSLSDTMEYNRAMYENSRIANDAGYRDRLASLDANASGSQGGYKSLLDRIAVNDSLLNSRV